MEISVKQELAHYVIGKIDEGIIENQNRDDWHYLLFNQDYYIIGYWQCEEWLKKHGISAFSAIKTCQSYEEDNFGEICKIYDNAEKTVNMLVFIYGEELLNGIDATDVNKIREELTEI